MTPREFREAFEAFRERVNAEAIAAKSSQEAYGEMKSLFARFDASERLMASEVLADWVVSNDESKRWDALALIRDYDITATVAALRVLEARLEQSDEPGAPYEWAKVNRLIGYLAGIDGAE